MRGRLFARLVWLFRRRAWQRLNSTIIEYKLELKGPRQRCDSFSRDLTASEEALAAARTALQEGDIDRGWRCWATAKRLDLLTLDKQGLNAASIALRKEADKLYNWRKSAVIDLLSLKEGEDQKRERVFQAALLRDEHYNNEAYKDEVRRNSALRLAIILIIAIISIICLSHVGYLAEVISKRDGTDSTSLFKILLCVAVVGVLGATISAITTMPKLLGPARIPEMISTIQVTVLRLLMGSGSAIVIYFVSQSQLYKYISKIPLDGYAILTLSFVAGFSERLVRRIVEKMIGGPSASSKTIES